MPTPITDFLNPGLRLPTSTHANIKKGIVSAYKSMHLHKAVHACCNGQNNAFITFPAFSVREFLFGMLYQAQSLTLQELSTSSSITSGRLQKKSRPVFTSRSSMLTTNVFITSAGAKSSYSKP